MIEGFLTVTGIKLANGKKMSNQRAVDVGLIKPFHTKPAGWGIGREEIPLGFNTMVDNGRQMMTYLLGGRTPTDSYKCSRFGIGTGTDVTNTARTELANPIAFYAPDPGAPTVLVNTKPIVGADYPAPFIVRIEFELTEAEAANNVITEFGLYAADTSAPTVNTTLITRKVCLGVPKDSTWATTFLWRIRV